MKENQKIFLEQFDQPLRKHIINFCNTIGAKKFDVYILLARKAACLIDVLIELDFMEINGVIVTDRILEYDTEWLSGKKIAIIDDTIISGTTIYKIINKLENINSKEIEVFAFCLNEYWYVDEMLSRTDGTSYLQEPYLKLDHTSSLKFCKNIVESLSITPRPYNVDFPIYEKVKFSSLNFQKLFESPIWKVNNTTTNKQNNYDITCLTLNPCKKFINDFDTSVGWNISHFAHLKLRIYSKKLIDLQGSVTYLSKVVPYILFNPISYDNVIHLVRTICKIERTESENVLKELNTDTSKLLFVQYYFSERLFKNWLNYAEDYLQKKLKPQISIRSLAFIFSPKLIQIIENFSFCNLMEIENSKQLFLTENIQLNNSVESINPIEILNYIIKPFLDIYYSKELPARRIVKKLKKKAFIDSQYIDIVNRLDDGISVTYLKNKISKAVNSQTDTNLILSLFLDNYVDNGIIVPITVCKGGFLYRGFRHGEEIVWGNYNNKLLARYFEKYLNEIHSTELPQTYFQKYLVLFLKIGLREGFLEEYSTITPNNLKIKLLSIKAHLFGQVSVYSEVEPYQTVDFTPIIDNDSKSYWTSEFLKDIGVLSLNKKNNFEFDFKKFDVPYSLEMEQNEPGDINEADLDQVNEIAEVFSYLRNTRLISEKELILLTSCVNLHDNTSSIAAELQIHLNSFQSYYNKISSHIRNSSFTLSRLKELRDLKENYIWTAVNSGQYKYLNYKLNTGLDLIKSISAKLNEQNNSFIARAWKKYWKFETDVANNEINELNVINDTMGGLLLELNILFACIHILIFELLVRGKQVSDYFAHLELENIKCDGSIEEIKTQIKEYEHKKNENTDLEINTKIVESLETERKNINRIKEKNKSDKKYWEEYINSNKSFIKEKLVELNKFNLPCKSSSISNNIILDIYIELKNSEITKLISEAFGTIELLNKDIEFSLKDYKLVVPKWGKIQQKVRYNSIIHVNSDVSDPIERESIASIIKLYLAEFELAEFGEESTRKSISLLRIDGAKAGDGYLIGGRGQFYFERMIKLSCNLLYQFSIKGINIKISLYPSFKENGIEAYYNNTTKNFDLIRENIFQNVEINMYENKIVIFDIHKQYQLSDFLHILLKSFQNTYHIEDNKVPNSEKNVFIIKLSDMNKKVNKTIGVITALPKELAAMKLMLDFIDNSNITPINDGNDYVSGYISNLNGSKTRVIIAIMKEMGNNNAASTATNMLRSFTEIEDIIVCGIAGGIPDINTVENHVRLGDIVVSDKNGILQYDSIKETDTEIKIRDTSSKPSSTLLGKVNILISEYESNKTPWIEYLDKYKGKLRNSTRPDSQNDILKIKGKIVDHPFDLDRNVNQPKVHYGPIGSSNTLLKNEDKRDFLKNKYGIKAIEMESSGIADGTWTLSKGYLVVRGIVDYCNPDKNDYWHNYAAICAATYTKCIIERL
jgi:nucleoside phosphorylase